MRRVLVPSISSSPLVIRRVKTTPLFPDQDEERALAHTRTTKRQVFATDMG
jgi:hypothetical protein